MVHRSEDESRQPYRIQRRRLGTIRFVREDGEFGFIEGEDFREDIFFHRTAWEGSSSLPDPLPKMFVEYELDEEHFAAEKRLRATIVRPTDRPEGKRLSGRDAPHLINRHHPNARKKRPTWRG